jgi:hypothetical protein
MTETVTSPGNGQPEPVAVDQRAVNIRAFFEANKEHPGVVFDAMQFYGVSAAELGADVSGVNITHWMRANGAHDGLGGLKVWAEASINQFEGFYGIANDPSAHVWVQDVLDTALRREHLYESVGLLGVADITSITHPWTLQLV